MKRIKWFWLILSGHPGKAAELVMGPAPYPELERLDNTL